MPQPTNPFIVSGKIDREYFCDRKDESAQLIRYIVNGHNVVLMSPRRMGKTGLIQYCFDYDRIKSDYLTIFIDILQTTSIKEFTFLLGKAVFSLLRPNKILIDKFIRTLKSLKGKFGYDPVSGTPSFDLSLGDITRPDYTLEEIFEWIEKSEIPVVVAIDEFQQVAKYAEGNAEAILRTHIQHSSNATFIFAGSQRHLLQQMFADYSRPFYNSASFIHLDPIPLPEYISFAKAMFNLGDIKIADDTVGNIYTLMEGNTFYMQKIFNLCYSYLRAGETCGKQQTDKAVEELHASYDTLFREMLSRLNESQKALLVAVAKNHKASGVTSAAFIRENALASASTVQNALKKLMDYDYLTREDNTYSVSDKFLRLWLLRTYTQA